MTPLTFQPAFDPHHAIFRTMRLRPIVLSSEALELDHVRILDFFLLFPFRIRAIRLKQVHQKYKKLSDKYVVLKPYGELPESSQLLEQMKPMQTAAFDTLARHELLERKELVHDRVASTERPLPGPIKVRVDALNANQADLIEFIRLLAQEYKLTGSDGLKARTGLMEYRYDAV